MRRSETTANRAIETASSEATGSLGRNFVPLLPDLWYIPVSGDDANPWATRIAYVTTGGSNDQSRVIAMAKGQQRSPKEKKKPKAEWNKKKKGGPVPVSSSTVAAQNPLGKKG